MDELIEKQCTELAGLVSVYKPELDHQFKEDILACIKKGANLNYQDKNGKTLLSYAIQYNFKAIEALLELGMDINFQNIHGHTPLMV